MGGTEVAGGSPECLLFEEQAMKTLMSEVVLMIVLLAAVVISGRL